MMKFEKHSYKCQEKDKDASITTSTEHFSVGSVNGSQ